MSEAARQESYPHITCDPEVSGGQPVVEGTRIPVTTLVRAHRLGMDFEEILVQYPGLKPEALHAALAYYLDEDVYAGVAAGLRRRGYDVRTAVEAGRLGSIVGSSSPGRSVSGRWCGRCVAFCRLVRPRS